MLNTKFIDIDKLKPSNTNLIKRLGMGLNSCSCKRFLLLKDLYASVLAVFLVTSKSFNLLEIKKLDEYHHF